MKDESIKNQLINMKQFKVIGSFILAIVVILFLPLYSYKVMPDRAKIDNRNEVNTNISVLDQQIQEQIKKNELAKLKAEHDLIISRGITPQLLQQQFIEKWDGKTPLYGTMPVTLFKNVQN